MTAVRLSTAFNLHRGFQSVRSHMKPEVYPLVAMMGGVTCLAIGFSSHHIYKNFYVIPNVEKQMAASGHPNFHN